MNTEKSGSWATKIAALNGGSVAALGAVCLALSLWWWSWAGILVGLVATASGSMELIGRRRLLAGRREGRRWLAGSQLLLLAAILLYAGHQLLSFDPKAFLQQLPPDVLEMLQSNFSASELQAVTASACRGLYVSVMIASVVYQGGLCLYYTLATRRLFQMPASRSGT